MTLEEVEEIIKQAVGFKKGRDEIKVSEVRMAPSPLDRMESGWLESQRWESYVGIARNTSLGVASLVALLLGRMILKRFRPETPPAPPDTQLQKEEVSAIELLTHRAKQNPEAVAELLKQWLDETEENRRRAA